MRIAALAIALTLGAAAPAWADARILMVQEAETSPPSFAPPPPPPPPPPPSLPSLPSPPAPPPLPDARFSFERSKDGFLRMDRLTGQVAFCAPRSAGWACETVPEERAALEKEIARLQEQIARLQEETAGLRRELAALRKPAPPPPRPPADLAPRPPGKEGDAIIKLPTQEDVDRATAALQRAWGRLVDMIDNLRKDLSRKSQPDRTTL